MAWHFIGIMGVLTLLVAIGIASKEGFEVAALRGLFFWLIVVIPMVFYERLIQGRHGDQYAYLSEL